MRKKAISIILSAAMIAAMLAGCGSTPAQEEQQQVSSPFHTKTDMFPCLFLFSRLIRCIAAGKSHSHLPYGRP